MIVVDVETTGLDPRRHAVVSIGAVDFNTPERTFYCECRPPIWAEIDDAALAVNGFTREQLGDPARPSHSHAIREFHLWADGCDHAVLAGTNVGSFDAPFLRYAFDWEQVHWPFGFRTVDLHSAAYLYELARSATEKRDFHKKDRTSALSLDGILKRLGLEPEPRPHNALVGARKAAEAFRALLGERVAA